MKKVTAWIFYILLEALLFKMSKWHSKMRWQLGYCREGCEVCYAWKCPSRKAGQTPYKKFRRGEMPF